MMADSRRKYGVGPSQPASRLRGRCASELLDNLIRPQQQRLRDRKAEGLRGLEVDDEVELRRLLDGKVGRLGAFQDPCDVPSCAPKYVESARTVREEDTAFRQRAGPTDHREPPLCREFGDLDSVHPEN